MTASSLQLRTLGALELFDVHGHSQTRLLGSGKPLALLTYLLCAPRRPQHRGQLCSLLWADAPPDRQRHNLRQALWRLRKTVGDVFTEVGDDLLTLDTELWCDRTQLLDAIRERRLDSAIELYRGAFLANVSLPGGDEFEDWAANERRYVDQQFGSALTDAARTGLTRHATERTRTALTALLRRGEASPSVLQAVAELSMAMGDVPLAEEAIEVLEQQERHDGQVDANPETQRLATTVRRAGLTSDARQTSRPLPLLTGRHYEWLTLTSLWDGVVNGSPAQASISGQPGVGKSRLLEELVQYCRENGGTAICLRAEPGERSIAFSFANQIARALSKLPGALGIHPQSAADLVTFDHTLYEIYRKAVRSDIPDADMPLRRINALLDLLLAVSENRPLALMLDDLHWCDDASLPVVKSLVGRVKDGALLVVCASRGVLDVLPNSESRRHFALAPLVELDTVAAIRSVGEWPAGRDVDAFIGTLAAQSRGIPRSLLERLDLALEQGVLVRTGASWSSPDWATATAHLHVSHPVDHLVASCTTRERELLLLAAVAGAPLHADALTALGFPRGDSIFDRLTHRGLLEMDAGQLRLSHDMVMERLLMLSVDGERERMHLRLGDALSEGSSAASQLSAMRHFVLANRLGGAATCLSRLVRRLRAEHDTRHVQSILRALFDGGVDEQTRRKLARMIPLFERSPYYRPAFLAAVVVVLLVIPFVMWRLTLRQPALAVIDGGGFVGQANVYGERVYRLVPPLVVRAIRPTASPSAFPRYVYARPGRGVARIVAGDSAQIDSLGHAVFGGLRVLAGDSVMTLHFESPGMSAVSHIVTLDHVRSGRSTVQLIGGEVNGRRFTDPELGIRVAPGTMMTGIVQLRYSAAWAAASVWASMTPTWGKRSAEGRDLSPAATPVRDDVLDLSIGLQAPSTPGRYRIIFAVNAEPSGGFTLSRTNWTLNTPLWDDGADLADIPDHELTLANTRGFAQTTVSYPSTWNTSAWRCTPRRLGDGRTVKECQQDIALAALTVRVEPR